MNSGHQCYENLCRTHAFFFSEATLRMKATQQFVARWGHPSTSRRSRRRQQQAQGGRANEQWQQKRSGYFCFISYISCLQCFLASSVVGSDLGRTRTCNPRLRGPMPYPLGHEAAASFVLCYTHCNYVVAKLFHFLLSQHAMIRNRIRVMLHLAYPRNNWQQWCSYVIFSQKEDSSATGASCPDSNATCVNLFDLGVNPLECPAEACVGKKHLWKGRANILYGIKLIPIAVRAPPAHWSY